MDKNYGQTSVRNYQELNRVLGLNQNDLNLKLLISSKLRIFTIKNFELNKSKIKQ